MKMLGSWSFATELLQNMLDVGHDRRNTFANAGGLRQPTEDDSFSIASQGVLAAPRFQDKVYMGQTPPSGRSRTRDIEMSGLFGCDNNSSAVKPLAPPLD